MDRVFLHPINTLTLSPTDTAAPTALPTATPTIPTATYTSTPTLTGQRTATSTPESSPTITTITPLALFTPNTATPAIVMDGFVKASTSESEFFKPGVCSPTSVKFTAQVGNPAGTGYVVLFVRFKSKLTGVTSEWTSITMQTIGAGTFVHELSAADMKGVASFRNSWVQYQFVATDSKTREIGRTGIFGDRLSVLECQPTPEASASPTGTLVVP
jgi:hypothetical protein